MLEYINQLRAVGAAPPRGIGWYSQRPFAIAIVGGLVAALGVYLRPTLYVWVANSRGILPPPEHTLEEE